jgi:hypothetical protein
VGGTGRRGAGFCGAGDGSPAVGETTPAADMGVGGTETVGALRAGAAGSAPSAEVGERTAEGAARSCFVYFGLKCASPLASALGRKLVKLGLMPGCVRRRSRMRMLRRSESCWPEFFAVAAAAAASKMLMRVRRSIWEGKRGSPPR